MFPCIGLSCESFKLTEKGYNYNQLEFMHKNMLLIIFSLGSVHRIYLQSICDFITHIDFITGAIIGFVIQNAVRFSIASE